jgi:tetratricopeptide (TPR) repeat protein
LARKKYRDAINYCEQVRREDKKNHKATYRKALAHLELNEFKEAEGEIDHLVLLEGSKADIDQLNAKLKQYVGKIDPEN